MKQVILDRFNTDDLKIRKDNWLEIYNDISEQCNIDTILNIGIGPGHACISWNEFLNNLWLAQYLENLEIDKAICDSAKATDNYLIANIQHGDVRKIDEIYSDNSFDLIFWSHGPEHIERKEWVATFKKIEKIASKVVILQMPWGDGYDYDTGHLSKSIKRGEIEKFGYTVYYDGVENTKNAGITGYKLP